MGIDRATGGNSPRWCVCVEVSVMEHVPRDVLAAWMAVESYANAEGECWPDNRMLARRMGVASVTSAQRALLKLAEYGLLKRIDRGGNRRRLVLLRRTSEPMSGAEWASLMERGEARTQTRTAPLSMLDVAPLE